MMFTRLHKILLALFVVQVGLASVILTRSDDSTARKPAAVLNGFDAAKVTKVAVYGKDATSPAVVVEKHGEQWVVGSSFDYPVAETKIGDLLASIAKLSAGSPIATQVGRHKQLRVDDAAFERKLVITAGTDTTLVLGSQAGPRRTAVRRGGDAAVYAVSGLNVWSIGTEPRDWIDPSYVKVSTEDLEKVTIERSDMRAELVREGDKWSPTIGGVAIKLAAGEEIDVVGIQHIVNSAASIELRSPGDPKRDASKPTATITLVRKAPTGNAAASAAPAAPIVIDVIAEAESYWVHDRTSSKAAVVDKGRLSDVVELARDKLVKKPTAQAAPVPPGGGTARNPNVPPAVMAQ